MDISHRTIEAALCLSGGLPNLERHFSEDTLDDLERHYPGGIRLKQLLAMYARDNWYRAFGLNGDFPPYDVSAGNLRQTLQAAFITAGSAFSTVTLPGILSNVANKFLREGFMAVENSWEKVTDISSAGDFKEVSSYTLTGNLTYEKVGPGGEIRHGTLGETGYGNRAETYAKMLTIPRVAIINDDLSALTKVPARLGRGAALAFNRVFWTEFLDNATFFTAERGNYFDAAGTALSANSVIAADVAFKAQRDPDGHPLGSRPRILLVPSGLDIPAKRLMSSQRLLEANDKGEDNPLAGMFDVVASEYLNDSTIPGYSPIAWYLLGSPMDLPTIETVFLNGQRMPTIETAEADFNVLGISMRGFHDFGVRKQEYRGGVKFAGTAEETEGG